MGFFSNIGSGPIDLLTSKIKVITGVTDKLLIGLDVDTNKVSGKWVIYTVRGWQRDGFLVDPKIILWWITKHNNDIESIKEINFLSHDDWKDYSKIKYFIRLVYNDCTYLYDLNRIKKEYNFDYYKCLYKKRK